MLKIAIGINKQESNKQEFKQSVNSLLREQCSQLYSSENKMKLNELLKIGILIQRTMNYINY